MHRDHCGVGRLYLFLLWLAVGGLIGGPGAGCGDGPGTDDPDAGRGDAAVTPDGGTPTDGAVSPDGTLQPDAGPATLCTPTATVQIAQLQSSVSSGTEVVDEDEAVILSIPQYLGPSTATLTGADLTVGAETLVTYTLSGAVPLARTVSATFDPAAGHILILVYAVNHPGDGGLGDHMLLLRLTLSGTTATLEELSCANPPTSQGSMFNMIHPEGDGVHYRAFRWAQTSQRVAVSGGAATWEPEVTLTSDGFCNADYFAHDPTGHRLLGYGELTIEGMPPDFEEFLDPVVFELPLVGGTHWSRVATSGDTPPRLEDEHGLYSTMGLWDDGGSRLLVMLDHWVYDPVWEEDRMVTGIWALSDTDQWSVINEDTGSCCVTGWWGTDDVENRRTLAWTSNGLSGLDLTEGNEGESASVTFDDVALTATPVRAVFDSTRDALLATSNSNGLLRMALGSGDHLWRRVDGGASLPAEAGYGYCLAHDPATDRAILFGGYSGTTSTASNAVFTLDLGATTPAWTQATTSGPTPAARSSAASLLDASSGTLYVVGGYDQSGPSPTHLADVVALDLATMTWRTVATLPAGRAEPLLHLAPGEELYVLLGSQLIPNQQATLMTDGYRVHLTTGAVDTLTITGDLPTYSSQSLSGLALPSGFTIVSPEPGVELYAVSVSGSTATLTRSQTCEESRAIGSGDGVADPQSGAAYLVGQSVWRVTE